MICRQKERYILSRRLRKPLSVGQCADSNTKKTKWLTADLGQPVDTTTNIQPALLKLVLFHKNYRFAMPPFNTKPSPPMHWSSLMNAWLYLYWASRAAWNTERTKITEKNKYCPLWGLLIKTTVLLCRHLIQNHLPLCTDNLWWMLDFICIGPVERRGTLNERKLQKKKQILSTVGFEPSSSKVPCLTSHCLTHLAGCGFLWMSYLKLVSCLWICIFIRCINDFERVLDDHEMYCRTVRRYSIRFVVQVDQCQFHSCFRNVVTDIHDNAQNVYTLTTE